MLYLQNEENYQVEKDRATAFSFNHTYVDIASEFLFVLSKGDEVEDEDEVTEEDGVENKDDTEK